MASLAVRRAILELLRRTEPARALRGGSGMLLRRGRELLRVRLRQESREILLAGEDLGERLAQVTARLDAHLLHVVSSVSASAVRRAESSWPMKSQVLRSRPPPP